MLYRAGVRKRIDTLSGVSFWRDGQTDELDLISDGYWMKVQKRALVRAAEYALRSLGRDVRLIFKARAADTTVKSRAFYPPASR